MANAGGAWDNAKKIVEVELKEKGTPLHAATVVGDTVGDPFKDTSSVAMNPVIKFTTLFGLLAVELAVKLTADAGSGVSHALAAVFFAVALVFVWRSFYGMRIGPGVVLIAGRGPGSGAAERRGRSDRIADFGDPVSNCAGGFRAGAACRVALTRLFRSRYNRPPSCLTAVPVCATVRRCRQPRSLSTKP